MTASPVTVVESYSKIRASRPGEVANVALFLASDESSHAGVDIAE